MLTRLSARLRLLLSFCLRCLGLRFVPRRHKRLVHFAVISVIGVDLVLVGAKLADLGFLLLSALIEVEEMITRDQLSDIHRDVHHDGGDHRNEGGTSNAS